MMVGRGEIPEPEIEIQGQYRLLYTQIDGNDDAVYLVFVSLPVLDFHFTGHEDPSPDRAILHARNSMKE